MKYYSIKNINVKEVIIVPVVISPLKDELNKALREASELLATRPEEKSALRYVNAIHRLIDVCEKRNRY